MKCSNGLLPDGPTCPGCGKERGPSGVDGGSWVHMPTCDNCDKVVMITTSWKGNVRIKKTITDKNGEIHQCPVRLFR